MITRQHQPARFHTTHENQQNPAPGLLPHQAEGLTELSRWLRPRQRPTPPEPVTPKNRIPAGCQTDHPTVANFATIAAAGFSMFHFGTNCRRRENLSGGIPPPPHFHRRRIGRRLDKNSVYANFAYATPRRAQVPFWNTWLTTANFAPGETRNSTP